MSSLWKPDKLTRSAINRGNKLAVQGKRRKPCEHCQRLFNSVGDERLCWSCYVRTRAPS